MSEYSHSLTIKADPQQVFNFVSEPRNFPKYLPTVHEATPQPGARIRIIGEANGRRYDDSGRFYVDDARRRMEWSSDGKNDYSGWLEVRDAVGGHESEVVVHLSFEPRPELAKELERQTGDRHRTIQKGLEDALESIKNIVEGRGSKVTSKASGR